MDIKVNTSYAEKTAFEKTEKKRSCCSILFKIFFYCCVRNKKNKSDKEKAVTSQPQFRPESPRSPSYLLKYKQASDRALNQQPSPQTRKRKIDSPISLKSFENKVPTMDHVFHKYPNLWAALKKRSKQKYSVENLLFCEDFLLREDTFSYYKELFDVYFLDKSSERQLNISFKLTQKINTAALYLIDARRFEENKENIDNLLKNVLDKIATTVWKDIFLDFQKSQNSQIQIL